MTDYSEKQVQLMETAEKLFSEKGFDGTSVRDIADQSGVNLAMISYYFGSKEKLMEALFKYRSASFKLSLETMINNTDLQPFEKIDHLIDQYVQKLLKQQYFQRVMVREQMTQNNPIISQSIMSMKQSNQLLIRQLIQEGQRKGDFKKHVDIPLIMSTLIGTVSHIVTSQHYYRELNNLQNLNEEDFHKHLRKKLVAHLKAIFKATLSNEE